MGPDQGLNLQHLPFCTCVANQTTNTYANIVACLFHQGSCLNQHSTFTLLKSDIISLPRLLSVKKEKVHYDMCTRTGPIYTLKQQANCLMFSTTLVYVGSYVWDSLIMRRSNSFAPIPPGAAPGSDGKCV